MDLQTLVQTLFTLYMNATSFAILCKVLQRLGISKITRQNDGPEDSRLEGTALARVCAKCYRILTCTFNLAPNFGVTLVHHLASLNLSLLFITTKLKLSSSV